MRGSHVRRPLCYQGSSRSQTWSANPWRNAVVGGGEITSAVFVQSSPDILRSAQPQKLCGLGGGGGHLFPVLAGLSSCGRSVIGFSGDFALSGVMIYVTLGVLIGGGTCGARFGAFTLRAAKGAPRNAEKEGVRGRRTRPPFSSRRLSLDHFLTCSTMA